MNIVYGKLEDLNVTLAKLEHKEFHVVSITPDPKGYRYSSAYVNINDSRIDKEEVKAYAGMNDDFDAEEFAAACVEYYGERFWGGFVKIISKEDAIEKLELCAA